jgi:hypothetical protein
MNILMGGWKKYKYSKGDYEYRSDARTFSNEFYYINFLDTDGKFMSKYSEQIKGERYAHNRAKWLSNNSWSLKNIPYKVVAIGVYSSREGHITSYFI